jgi:glycosyltransferase involved in cell wall biosynthesis
MPHSPLVSVIIIFLNAAEFLGEAVESVLAQTYQNWELLLVDDGSTDGSSLLAQEYAEHYPSLIFYLDHPCHQNFGMSAARNLGIQHANGAYIAFLDADDIWLEQRLTTHVTILESHPDTGMLYGSTLYWYSWTGDPKDARLDHVPDMRVQRNTTFAPPLFLEKWLEGKIEVPCTCSILVRSQVAKTVGGFEMMFKGMYEDQAFYAKVSLETPVIATDDCLAWYRQHPNSHVAVTIRSGNLNSTHLTFLKWLQSYCSHKAIADPLILMAIHRKIWLYDNGNSWLISAKLSRQIKKWILKIEEQILPHSLRLRLWAHRTV